MGWRKKNREQKIYFSGAEKKLQGKLFFRIQFFWWRNFQCCGDLNNSANGDPNLYPLYFVVY